MYRIRNRFLQLILPVLLCFSCIGVANATEKGFYLGGAYGEAELDDVGELNQVCIDNGLVCQVQDSDTAIKLFLGYQFNNYFGIEFGYMDLGTLTAGTTSPAVANVGLGIEGGYISLLPQIPIGEHVALFLRLGAVAGDATLSASIPSFGVSESESNALAGVEYGIGAMVNLGKNVSLRFEYDKVRFDEVLELAGFQVDSPDMSIFSGSIVIRFSK